MEEKGPGVTLNANMKVSGIVACKGVLFVGLVSSNITCK